MQRYARCRAQPRNGGPPRALGQRLGYRSNLTRRRRPANSKVFELCVAGSTNCPLLHNADPRNADPHNADPHNADAYRVKLSHRRSFSKKP